MPNHLPESIIDGQSTSEDAEGQASTGHGHGISNEDPTFPYPDAGCVPIQRSPGWEERTPPRTDTNAVKLPFSYNLDRITRSFGVSCNVNRGPGAPIKASDARAFDLGACMP